MPMDKCIKELKAIIEIKDDPQWQYSKSRNKALNQWLDKWLAEIEVSQLVMNTKYMTSEFQDVIKEQLARNCQEQLAEEVIEYTTTNNKVQSKMLALRKKPRSDN